MKHFLCALLCATILTSASFAQPHPKLKIFKHLAEHVLLGMGTELAVSQVAGGRKHYWPGLAATAITAGFKEGTDAHDGKDSKKEAAWHAFSIMMGAGAMAAVRH